MSGLEQRRAPRTIVDVEAVLNLFGRPAAQGTIQDLSIVGSLFIPERPIDLPPNAEGRLRFAMPTAVEWIEPHVTVRRTTSFNRGTGDEALAIGFEFTKLDPNHERAIAVGAMEWGSHRLREYHVAARCFVQGVDEHRRYSRFGKVSRATRNTARVSVASSGELTRGAKVKLKVASQWVDSHLEEMRPERHGVELVLRITSWGRDFFLHEARRDSLADPAVARFPM